MGCRGKLTRAGAFYVSRSTEKKMCRVFFSVEELKQHPLNKWRAGEDRYCKVCHHEQFTRICFVPKKMQILRSSNNIVIVLGHGIAY